MLTLSEDQWRDLQARDRRNFVGAVCDQFLAKRPEVLAGLGRQVVEHRMQLADDLALNIGMRSTPHIVHLMYIIADAPQLLDDPVFNAYMRKPGLRPEQRFDDLMAVMKKKLEGNER